MDLRAIGWRYWTIAALVLLALLIVFMPLRFALGATGADPRMLNARAVGGTLWDGRIDGLTVGGVPLGLVDAHMGFLSLLAGRTYLTIERPEALAAAQPLSLSLSSGGGGFALDRASGRIAGDTLFAPLPVQTISFDAVTVEFAGDRCIVAAGSVQLMMQSAVLGLPLHQGLTGTPRCDGDAVVIPLRGQSGMEKLDLRIAASGVSTPA